MIDMWVMAMITIVILDELLLWMRCRQLRRRRSWRPSWSPGGHLWAMAAILERPSCDVIGAIPTPILLFTTNLRIFSCRTQNLAYAYHLHFRWRTAYQGSAYRIPSKKVGIRRTEKGGYSLITGMILMYTLN